MKLREYRQCPLPSRNSLRCQRSVEVLHLRERLLQSPGIGVDGDTLRGEPQVRGGAHYITAICANANHSCELGPFCYPLKRYWTNPATNESGQIPRRVDGQAGRCLFGAAHNRRALSQPQRLRRGRSDATWADPAEIDRLDCCGSRMSLMTLEGAKSKMPEQLHCARPPNDQAYLRPDQSRHVRSSAGTP